MASIPSPKKVLFLAADRAAGQLCLRVFSRFQKTGLIQLSGLVSTPGLHQKALNELGQPLDFISADERNEDLILSHIAQRSSDLLISVQHPWILPEKMIQAVHGRAFNIHFAKLPDYRGHHTHIHPILNGEKSISTTLHWMATQVDRGHVAFEHVTPIHDNDTSFSLYQKAVEACALLLERLLSRLTEGGEIPRSLITGEGRYYKINSLEGLKKIDDPSNSDELALKARAFYYPPHEPAYVEVGGKKYYVLPETDAYL